MVHAFYCIFRNSIYNNGFELFQRKKWRKSNISIRLIVDCIDITNTGACSLIYMKSTFAFQYYLQQIHLSSLQVSATWLNWIIFRTFCTLPLMYMLNFHTFIFEVLGWQCCIRCVMGGGPGGPIPYRIYIDSGIVFMCVIGLSPVSPLLAPAGLCYFLFCAPLWRRNCIYMYRPNFDTGGIRWPFLSDIFLSAICVAQILLCTTSK